MTHLKFDNHSGAFWNGVDKILPDYRERKTWLQSNGVDTDLSINRLMTNWYKGNHETETSSKPSLA